jgi:AraC-like DNA-binding protein
MSGQDALEQSLITLGYFRLLLRAFGDAPERRAAILAGTGVGEALLSDPTADITLFQQLRQIDNLAELLGDGWPLLTPDLFGVVTHGALGVAAITAPDAARALQVVARYGHARGPFAARRLARTPSEWTIELRPSVPLTERQWRTLSEVNFLAMRAVLSAVLGHTPQDAGYHFIGQAPPYEHRAREVLGAGVSYGAPSTSFALPTAHLDAPSPYTDPGLHARTIDELERARKQRSGASDLRSRLERLLATNPSGRLDAEAAARALGVSSRTLARRLADAGSSYRGLSDRELRARAKRLLAAGDFSQAEIAERLGYADPTSFSRARRRWFPDETSE